MTSEAYEMNTAASETPAAAAAAQPEPVATIMNDPFGWYAAISVRRPRQMFCAAWTVILLMCAAGFPLFEQTPTSDYDWLMGKNKIVSRSYALKKVQEETSLYTKLAERSVKQNEQLMHFIYEAKSGGGNILAPAMIKEMLSIEKTFFTVRRGPRRPRKNPR